MIFLTTDVHGTLVNDARFQTLEQGGPQNSGILDITVGSAATENFEDEIDDQVGEGNGRLVDDVFLEGRPPNGVAMQLLERRHLLLRRGQGHAQPPDGHPEGDQRQAPGAGSQRRPGRRRPPVGRYVLNYQK